MRLSPGAPSLPFCCWGSLSAAHFLAFQVSVQVFFFCFVFFQGSSLFSRFLLFRLLECRSVADMSGFWTRQFRPFPLNGRSQSALSGDILICIMVSSHRLRLPDVLRSSATPHHVLQVRRRGPLNPSPSSLQTRPDRSIINPSRHVLNQPTNE